MLTPYDFILTKENFLFVVRNYEEIDGFVIASPKYVPYQLAKTRFREKTWQMLGEEWSRINNPLDPIPNTPDNVLHYLRDYEQTSNGFKIRGKDIKNKFKAKEGIARLLYSGSEWKQSKIKNHTRRLVKFLIRTTSKSNLGLTGSSLFDGEIEDFSDIDLVVYGSDQYKRISESLRNNPIPEIHFRTLKEWEGFYDHYGVMTSISKEQFARHMSHKYDQLLIGGIPVSIFAVRNRPDMNFYLAHKKANIEYGDYIELEARVSDDSESMFLPSFYEIDNGNIRYRVYNENRSFLFQAGINDKIIVKGEHGIDPKRDNWINITPHNKGFILRADEK